LHRELRCRDDREATLIKVSGIKAAIAERLVQRELASDFLLRLSAPETQKAKEGDALREPAADGRDRETAECDLAAILRGI
jgi:hypothetical protein